ncbi:right-handed parallel beta-helix repeat-containing protein [bacterium]|nr:right-handed parallel beta-helix repeat-containing protein [candidate division CSSED10-310 bacterium]
MKVRLVLVLIACITAPVLHAAEVHVPSQYGTIQAGMDAAQPGDEVIVADGVYSGDGNRDLQFYGKAVTVRSANGPGTCIIDCEGSGSDYRRGFFCHFNETPASVIRGFEIRNGYAGGPYPYYSGAGISCYDGASPTIIECRFTNGTARYGGGVRCSMNAHVTILDCVFEGNHAVYGGALLVGGYSEVTLNNCIFIHNDADEGGAITLDYSGYLTAVNCLIAGNSAVNFGGAIRDNNDNQAVFTNCTITGNTSQGGGAVYAFDSTQPSFVNCILWHNQPDEVLLVTAGTDITYSIVEGGWPGTGNIDADPLFIPSYIGDYCLSQVAAGQSLDSPGLDGGSLAATEVCFDLATGDACMSQLTTRTDVLPDEGVVDMGFHYLPRPPDPSPTASPTMPPYSPTPPATGTPETTPTPTPRNQGPRVMVAGYMDTRLGQFSGGLLTITAYIQDMDGDPIRRIYLFYGGQPTGITHQCASNDGTYIWNWSLEFTCSLPPGELLFEIYAVDDQGLWSRPWPYLTATGTIGADWTKAWSSARMHAVPGDPGGPEIQLAGFWDTDVDETGHLSILALATHPQGNQAITQVELQYEGVNTGVFLLDDGAHGDFAAGDGVYGMSLDITPGSVPGGMYLFQIVARDSSGRHSDTWPYLTINPENATPTPAASGTPTPTDTPSQTPIPGATSTPTPTPTITPTPPRNCLTINLDPPQFDFGYWWVGDTGPEETVLIITNTCDSQVTVTLGIDNPHNFTITNPPDCDAGCQHQLAAGAGLELRMRFTPQSATLIEGYLSIDEPSADPILIYLHGIGRWI